MPRRKRPDLPGIPVHVIQRGVERGPCFLVDEDRDRYRHWLTLAAQREGCAVHAYALMGNHVHLLLTPLDSGAMPRTMHALGSRYVSYYNERHGRAGVLWERRYRSCFIDTDHYLFQCHRYIELNPVRAGLAPDPADYPWSSFGCLALGRSDPLVSAHPRITEMGPDAARRGDAYARMVGNVLAQDDWTSLRRETRQEGAYGGDAFRLEVGRQAGLGDLNRRPGRRRV